MIYPEHYSSLGGILCDAMIQYKTDTALIEDNRKREQLRLSYREFRQAALGLASAMQQHSIAADSRVAILMSNQSKWLISAYAALYRGAILVPLDYNRDLRGSQRWG